MPKPLFVNRFLAGLDRAQSPAPMRYDSELRLMVTRDGEPFVEAVSPRMMGTEQRTLPQYDRETTNSRRGELSRRNPDGVLAMDTRLGTRGKDPDPEPSASPASGSARARRSVSAERPLSANRL